MRQNSSVIKAGGVMVGLALALVLGAYTEVRAQPGGGYFYEAIQIQIECELIWTQEEAPPEETVTTFPEMENAPANTGAQQAEQEDEGDAIQGESCPGA